MRPGQARPKGATAPAAPDDILTLKEYCRRDGDRILEAVDAGNWAEVARLGRGLKSAGPFLGFDEVGRRGLEIEQAGKAADSERVRRAFGGLNDHLRAVRVVVASPMTG